MDEISIRRDRSTSRLEEMRSKLVPAEKIVKGKACIYATGSYGRKEASLDSDLDLFILGKNNGSVREDGAHGSQLSRLDEIVVKAQVIQTARKMKIAEFDADGRYFYHYSISQFTKILGKPEDDARNTFTARLLLLLESRPLIGLSVYEDAMADVIAAYWRDFSDHSDDFVPAFLANDIIRLWRTFCVNYEAKLHGAEGQEIVQGKIKNYNLKHSRLLTCYSGLVYLLATFGIRGRVTPEDAQEMARISPIERLEWIRLSGRYSEAYVHIDRAINLYREFLESKNLSEADRRNIFSDKQRRAPFMERARNFGDAVFHTLNIVGGQNRFHRLLVV